MTDDTLNQMYATYRDNCPDTPALSFEDWYKDYYLVDVWVSASHAVGVNVYEFAADDEDVMPYDKHDAVLVAKAFSNLTH